MPCTTTLRLKAIRNGELESTCPNCLACALKEVAACRSIITQQMENVLTLWMHEDLQLAVIFQWEYFQNNYCSVKKATPTLVQLEHPC